jgi:hypothetical protein
MLTFARFAFLVSLSATIPVVFAIDTHDKQDQNKQQTKDDKKKAEPAKKEAPAADERLDRRNSRMKERNREMDGLLNKQKK